MYTFSVWIGPICHVVSGRSFRTLLEILAEFRTPLYCNSADSPYSSFLPSYYADI